MTSLIMMYVFYDKNGDIKAITPHLDEGFSAIYSSITLPLSDLEIFLLGEKNTFDYYIKTTEKITGTTYKLTKKQTKVSYTRTLDSYLTKIDKYDSAKDILLITNNVPERFVSIEINRVFKELYLADSATEDHTETVSNFFNNGLSTLYLTKRNNPYHLLFTFSFTPRDFLSTNRLYFNYDGAYNNASIYTKKLISGYGYKEKVD